MISEIINFANHLLNGLDNFANYDENDSFYLLLHKFMIHKFLGYQAMLYLSDFYDFYVI